MDKILYKLNDKATAPKELLGGKGYFLNEMKKMDLPVPEACILTTALWKKYQESPEAVEKELKKKVIPEIVKHLTAENGGQMPLVSVRSGAPVSMPGMMDTILNLGLNKDTIQKFSKENSNKFAIDCYKRFLCMYGEIALELPEDDLDKALRKEYDTTEEVEKEFQKIYKKHKMELPEGKIEAQLYVAIVAVLKSWNNERAILYRQMNKIPDDIGTAVVIQKMVFGNRNENSAAGVIFSRDTISGKNEVVGEYLSLSQGEDVVNGKVTPPDFSEMKYTHENAYHELRDIAKKLEMQYKTIQDVEFTVDSGKVYILQTRTAKCSPYASFKITMDMHKVKEISAKEVLERIKLDDYFALNTKQIDPGFEGLPDGVGLPASNGAIKARVVFGIGGSKKFEEPTVLFAKETTPDDLPIMQQVHAIVTASGGTTSHAAVVARSMNKCCIVGCDNLKIQKKGTETETVATLGGKPVKEGDWVTLDAKNGKIWLGDNIKIIDGDKDPAFTALEDLVFDAYPEWTRVVSKVDDIFKDKISWFATYDLDDKEDFFVKKELTDACEFITGTIDLTGKIDFLQNKYNKIMPFSDHVAKMSFEKKMKALLTYFGNKNDFDIYLGKYHDEYVTEFKKKGFKIRDNNSVTFQPYGEKMENGKTYVVSELNPSLVQGKEKVSVAIGSKNALLKILK